MKRAVVFVLCICLIAGLAGCDLWLTGNYTKVVPHPIEKEPAQTDKVEVSNYTQLRDALADVVTAGNQNAVIYYPKAEINVVSAYTEAAIRYVTQEHPVGAYAVADITYEVGTSSGVQAVALQISYTKSTAQIRMLQSASNLSGAKDMIAKALEKCEPSVVFYLDNYDGTDFVQFVSDYVDGHPDVCMEFPQVSAMAYPNEGPERVIELVFSYRTSRDVLRDMQETVALFFESAELYVSGDGAMWEKYAQLYSMLMTRHDYTLQTSITPSYSLLRHGVGDSKAFALVYAAMCRRAGLPCETVTGTKNGEVYTWNVIRDGSNLYFVDLIYSSEIGSFTAKTEPEMTGYVWDYSAYR